MTAQNNLNQWKQSKIERTRLSLVNREADARSAKLQKGLQAFFSEHAQKLSDQSTQNEQR